MRVLAAGDRSHIGAVLIRFLRLFGHEVDGLDPRLHEGCDLDPASAGHDTHDRHPRARCI